MLPTLILLRFDSANHINLNDNFTKGKLNRMNFLSAIYDAMSRDWDECFEPDPVSKRDKWLLDRDNGNVLAVAMRALSEGCGADIAKCEGNDPLHDFNLDDGTPTPTANHVYCDYNVGP
jgi:hypothetical protein